MPYLLGLKWQDFIIIKRLTQTCVRYIIIIGQATGGKIMGENQLNYKEKIIEMINKIENVDILNYIYIIISDIMVEKEEEKHE